MRPNMLGAVIQHVRASSEVSALVAARVASELQDSWTMPIKSVIIRASGGPPGTPNNHFMVSRIDVFCYGETAFEADKVWRTVDPVLAPGQEALSSFRANGCRIYDISPERGFSSEVEPDTTWNRTSCTYLVTWAGVP